MSVRDESAQAVEQHFAHFYKVMGIVPPSVAHAQRMEESRKVIDQMARILCKKTKPPRGQEFRCEFCHCFVERPCYNLNETTNCKLF